MPSDILLNRHMAKLGIEPSAVLWSEGHLTIDEVSLFFSVPIAEAAQKLNVCGSVLQRICKENGILRWPYRKVIAGKSIEEIKEEGLKEIAANPSNYKKVEKQQTDTTEGVTALSVATSASIPSSTPQSRPDSTVGVKGCGSDIPGRQAEVAATQLRNSPQRVMAAQAKTPFHGNTSSQRLGHPSTPAHVASPAAPYGRSSVAISQTAQKQKVAVPTSPDDFKLGFPSKCLSTTSTRWWGSTEMNVPSAGNVVGDKEVLATELDCCSKGSIQSLESVNKIGPSTTASNLLVRSRMKAVSRGKSSLAHAVTRGYGLHKLGAKDAAILRFVFAENLPEHWTSAFPPIS